MKNKSILLILSCAFIIIISVTSDQSFSLRQVVILSRHNVRTPLSKILSDTTPKPWPHWKVKPGFLTERGAKLEGFMGVFFSAWLKNTGLLQNGCPDEEDFYVYANKKQRTKASAQAFVDKAFPNCNITVHFSNADEMDPIFNPVIHNTSSIFKQIALDHMQERLKHLHLNHTYEALETILDYEESEICQKDKKCHLNTDKNKLNIIVGQKPMVSGPLKIGNSVIDAFVMEFYNGLPINEVAWGHVSTRQQWRTIMNLSRGYHNVIFNTTVIAQDIAEPLIKYMSRIFFNDKPTKATLLMGHDANIYTILNGMKFKSYNLQNQYEKIPVGGKIVFQKWFDIENKRDLLKIDYIYQSTKQLRDGVELSLENPPKFKTLQLMECKVDGKGFCLWEDFEKFMKRLC